MDFNRPSQRVSGFLVRHARALIIQDILKGGILVTAVGLDVLRRQKD